MAKVGRTPIDGEKLEALLFKLGYAHATTRRRSYPNAKHESNHVEAEWTLAGAIVLRPVSLCRCLQLSPHSPDGSIV